MLIEFRCTNLSEFDAAKGRYVECDELIIASEGGMGAKLKAMKITRLLRLAKMLRLAKLIKIVKQIDENYAGVWTISKRA